MVKLLALLQLKSTNHQPAFPVYSRISLGNAADLLLAIVGYWAFGNAVAPFIVLSFTTPSYGSTIANAFLIAQVSALQLIAHGASPFNFRTKFIPVLRYWVGRNCQRACISCHGRPVKGGRHPC